MVEGLSLLLVSLVAALVWRACTRSSKEQRTVKISVKTSNSVETAFTSKTTHTNYQWLTERLTPEKEVGGARNKTISNISVAFEKMVKFCWRKGLPEGRWGCRTESESREAVGGGVYLPSLILTGSRPLIVVSTTTHVFQVWWTKN